MSLVPHWLPSDSLSLGPSSLDSEGLVDESTSLNIRNEWRGAYLVSAEHW